MNFEVRKEKRNIAWKVISTLILAFCTFIQYLTCIGNLILIHQMLNVIIPIPTECAMTDMTIYTIMFAGGVPIFFLLFMMKQRKTSVIDVIYLGLQLILIAGLLITIYIIAPHYPYDHMGICAWRPFSRMNFLLLVAVINSVVASITIGGRWYKKRRLKNITKSPEK